MQAPQASQSAFFLRGCRQHTQLSNWRTVSTGRIVNKLPLFTQRSMEGTSWEVNDSFLKMPFSNQAPDSLPPQCHPHAPVLKGPCPAAMLVLWANGVNLGGFQPSFFAHHTTPSRPQLQLVGA